METKTRSRPVVTRNISNEIAVERVFNLSVTKVWQAWTEPDTFKKWWGPKDFTCSSSSIDLKTGGKYLNCMLSPKGEEYWSTGTFKEIIPDKRLVFTDSFSDEKGNIVSAESHNMPGDWPMELLITVTLEEEEDGKTKLRLLHEGIPREMQKDCIQSWNESFDKLGKIDND
jgi:uncharacterized protein YndB with AHSA1/START domain